MTPEPTPDRFSRAVVVIDAVGRWKHDMFSHWTFGDLLLVKPREIRQHLREAPATTRFQLRPRHLAPGLWEVNLPLPPGWLFELMPLSARILAATASRFAQTRPWTLILTLPQYHRVIDHIPRRDATVTYYAYDDYRDNWPGRSPSVDCTERAMACKADVILCAAAQRLEEFAGTPAAMGGRLHHLPVAAPEDWLAELARDHPEPAQVRGLPSPRFLCFGALTGRIDFRWFSAVARRFPSGSVILAGKLPRPDQGDGAWWADASVCLSLPNVHAIDWVPEPDRAGLLQSADVLLMGHSKCRFNLGSCPAKLWDYFAVGKPVVATPNCPEVLRHTDLVYVGRDPEGYAAAAARALDERSDQFRHARRAEAMRHSAGEMARRLESLLAASRRPLNPTSP